MPGSPNNPAVMNNKSCKLRRFAAVAYVQANENIEEATRIFKEKISKTKHVVSRPDKFVATWGPRFSETGTVKNAPKAGRPHKLLREQLQHCCTVFKKGYNDNGKYKPFLSINHALACVQYLKTICNEYEILPKDLLAMMRRFDKNLKKRRLHFRGPFSQKIKQARVQIARTLYYKPKQYFDRVFWIDAKKIHVVPGGVSGWVDAAAEDYVIEDKRCTHGSASGKKMQFYCCVNAMVGPVCMVYVTGTTGLKGFGNRKYKVNSHSHVLKNDGDNMIVGLFKLFILLKYVLNKYSTSQMSL
jgi:transposase